MKSAPTGPSAGTSSAIVTAYQPWGCGSPGRKTASRVCQSFSITAVALAIAFSSRRSPQAGSIIDSFR